MRRGHDQPNAQPIAVVNVRHRLREIDMFFQKRDKVHQTLKRLTSRLSRAKIRYAIMGAMAVNLHGARRTTDDVDILLTQAGLEQFRRKLSRFYEQAEGRPRRFIELRSGVSIDFLVTGRFPGSGKPGPIAFPDPEEAGVEIEDVLVVDLPKLIELKLCARRYYDFGDVVFLIRVHDLDESYLDNLHSAVHKDFIECLGEKRREDEYEARED